MKLQFTGNYSPKTLHAMAAALSQAAAYIQENGWCKDTLRIAAGEEWLPGRGLVQRPSRVCMMGAVQEAMADLPARLRFHAYDFVHQALDGVPMQDYNDAQSNPKPIIKKLLKVSAAIEERAEFLEQRRQEVR